MSALELELNSTQQVSTLSTCSAVTVKLVLPEQKTKALGPCEMLDLCPAEGASMFCQKAHHGLVLSEKLPGVD